MKIAYAGVLLLMSLVISLTGQAQKPKKKIPSRYPTVMVKAPISKSAVEKKKTRAMPHRTAKKSVPVNVHAIEKNRREAWHMMRDHELMLKIQNAINSYTNKNANYATKANAIMNVHRLYDQLSTKEYKEKANSALKRHKMSIETIKKESNESKALTHFGHLMHAHEKKSGSEKLTQTTAQKLMKSYEQLNAERRALADKHLQKAGLSANELRQMATTKKVEAKAVKAKTSAPVKTVTKQKTVSKK